MSHVKEKNRLTLTDLISSKNRLLMFDIKTLYHKYADGLVLLSFLNTHCALTLTHHSCCGYLHLNACYSALLL